MSKPHEAEDAPEYRDYLGEAMEEHNAGPVKKTGFMATVFTVGIAYALALVALVLWRYFGPLDLAYAYFAFATLLISPFAGIFVFVIGFLRRYRYVLGKPVERVGIAIFVLGWIGFFINLSNPIQ